jgi:hypothetical protein
MKRLSTFMALACAFGIMLCAATAEAGLPRVLSMGLEEDTAWMIESDEVQIMDNAAYIGKVAPQLTAGYASSLLANPYGWLIFNPMTNLNLMIAAGMPLEDTAFIGAGNLGSGVGLHYEQFNVGGSYDLGSLIIGAATSFSYMEEKLASDSDTNLVWTFDVGAIKEIGSSMSVDAGIFLNVWSADTPSTTYERTTADFGLNARFNWAISEMNTLHVYGKYAFLGRSDTVGGTETEMNYHNLYMGVSDEMHITKNSLVFAGVQYNMTDAAAENLDTYTHQIKLAFGCEVDMFKVVRGRIGVNRTVFDRDTTDPGDTIDDTENATTVAFGLGLTLGNVVFDMNVTTALLTNGPNFISGASNNWSTDFEAKYYFETGSQE